MCRRTGLAPSYLSRLESGKIQPTVSTALRLARALHVSLDELLAPSPPEVHGRVCPVSPSGECILDLPELEARAGGKALRHVLTGSQIRLLQRFTALVQRSDGELLGALNVLLRGLERAKS